VDGRPNRRNKAAFSNFSGVEWTRPQYSVDNMLLRFITMTNAKQSTSAFYDLEVALFREEMCQAFVRTLYNGKWLIKVRVEKLG